jgi:hypothetical protein
VKHPYPEIIVLTLAAAVASAHYPAAQFKGQQIAITHPKATGTDCEAVTNAPAKLCLRPMEACYTPPDREPPFGFRPHAEVMRLGPRLEAVLFTAESSSCGSGGLHFLSLLDVRDGKILNLLPEVIVSNQGEYSIRLEPSVSPIAMFMTADAIWAKEETHFGRHHFRVTVYTFDASHFAYSQRIQYVTGSKYPTLDDVERISVLAHEKSEILSRLSQSKD